MKKTILILLMAALLLNIAFATPQKERAYNDYKTVIEKTVGMLSNSDAIKFAQKYGLQILNVTWEDTGRYKNSSVGPNISDMTIQVQSKNPKTNQFQLYCMPVIRYPNFSDISCDVNPEKFYLLVGNEKGKKLKKITLKEYLSNFRSYLNKPESWKGNNQSLFAPNRDTHVLVSAQACFLPIPKQGIAEFNPVLFNYQSYKDNPAVLAIIATREGTSATIIDNQRDGFDAGWTWGQRLFFNQKGERASFTGKRLSDFLATNKNTKNQQTVQLGDKKANKNEGLNMVLLIQVPLKYKALPRVNYAEDSLKCAAPPTSNVESAVIGHGKVEGPFTEIDNLAIERDDNFPVRVTVQFYKATDNGVVSTQDMKDIADQIKKVYDQSDYVGSLVVDGATIRPTEYKGPKIQPFDWWDKFWKQYEKEFKISREEAMQRLKHLLGPSWAPKNMYDLDKKLKDNKVK